MFASLILQRLKQYNVDAYIWSTQFGFKSGLGTADALFVVRRMLERIWNEKDGSGIFLALDWAKAFDSIAPSSLISALKRFGIPDHFAKMVQAIYFSWEFYVAECGVDSETHRQHFGISLGCPLSPYLFAIVMSIVMGDARQRLQDVHGILLSQNVVNDLLYADDTLLVGRQSATISKYLACVVEVGREHGLDMNWKKVELLNINCDGDIIRPDGQIVDPKDSLIYLGSLVAANGDVNSELA